MAERKKIIAVDFDGTLVEHKWPDIGATNKQVLDYCKAEQENGARIILWTNRAGETLDAAVKWCEENGLRLDAVNDNIQASVDYFGVNTRKIFADEFIDDRSNTGFDLPYKPSEEGTTSSWAEHETELAIQSEKADSEGDEWQYGVGCYQSALRAFKSLCRDGHSGMSIQVTKSILNRLVDGRPLTPIENLPEVWSEVVFDEQDKVKHYQCKRVSSLFKDVAEDGTVTYNDVNRVLCYDTLSQSVWHNGLADRLVNKIFPITMPYLPSAKHYQVNCEEFLVDPKNGDYDTVAYLNIIAPDGHTIELNRYFKDDGTTMVQIEKEEYEQRKANRITKK
jgi:hypothetical protein